MSESVRALPLAVYYLQKRELESYDSLFLLYNLKHSSADKKPLNFTFRQVTTTVLVTFWINFGT